MAYFNKYKEVEIQLPDSHIRFGGEIRLEPFRGIEYPRGSGQVYEIPNTRRVALDWTPNIILNHGLDKYCDYNEGGYSDQALGGIVGTSSQAEQATDSGCISPVAYVGQAAGSNDNDAQATPPYYGWAQRKFRFSPNFGGGNININEVAVSGLNTGTLATVNAAATARALTRDGNGDPSSITILADEYLDFFYRRRQYPGYIDAAGSPQDGTGTIVFDGVNYNYTIRPAKVTHADWGGYALRYNSITSGYGYGFSNGVVFSSDAVIGPVTGIPSASDYDSIFYTQGKGWGSYSQGTYNQDAYISADLDDGNVSGGFKAIAILCSRGLYQVVFDNPIPKDDTKIMTYWQNYSWARKAL